MTNGEKIISDFPYIEIKGQDEVFTTIQIDTKGSGTPIIVYTDWWNAEYKEPTKALEQEPTIDYRRAFKIACELLSGSVLYGIDSDKIFEIMMQKDGLVSNDSYERYILNHLQELDRGQYEVVEE